MKDNFEQYMVLMRELRELRQKYDWKESKREDEILDEMDEIWWKLSEKEREIINLEIVSLNIKEKR